MKTFQRKIKVVVEYTWLVIACISVVFCILSIKKDGLLHTDSISFFFIIIVSTLMFLYRRNQRLSKKT